MTIEQFIIDLLKHHNCVVVPNFGGFIANYQPAIIDSVSKTITPPSKQVLFNANLLKNDGLLANYVSEKRGITYPESLVEIENKSKEWKQILTNDKRLAFGEIGFLYEQDGSIVFEQNRDINLWLKAYGLSSIQFISAKDIAEQNVEQKKVILEEKSILKSEIKEEKVETPSISLSVNEKIEALPPKEESSKIIPLTTEKKSRKRWGYLAIACALPLLFYTYWIPMKTNFLESGNLQLSDFNPFHSNVLATNYRQRESIVEFGKMDEFETLDQKTKDLASDVEYYHYQFDETTFIPVKLNHKDVTIETEIDEGNGIESLSTTVANSAKMYPFQLIAGCFSVHENAEGLVAELGKNGYPAYILDQHKGLHRVAVNGFQDIKTAKAAKADLKSKSYSTWILKQ